MILGINNIGEIKYSVTLNNSTYPLDTIEKQNDLGVIIDTKLSFDNHINQAVNKATKLTKIIRSTFQFLDKDAFLPLYKTMVRTHLDYAIAVWYPYKKTYYCNRKRPKKSNKRITRDEKLNLYRKIKIIKTSLIII